jgi:hypothetical protein
MAKKLNRLVNLALALIAGLALVDQLSRPPAERTWHGYILRVPYDFRPPTLARVKERLWNPNDERVIVPTVIGVGWSVNLYQLWRRALLLIA